jgi:hypothetical protein
MVIPNKIIRPIRMQKIRIQLVISHFPINITLYVIAQIIRNIDTLTNQWITDPHLPPGDLFHATLNAIAFITNNSKYSYNGEIGKPKGSCINSKINLYIFSP